jgi:serine/threonine protein kinase
VLVLPDSSIRIIDFGLCQIPDGETITLAEEGVGTPNYMAPECEAGSLDEVSSKADLYSIGKLLWSAVTNKMAFSRERPVYSEKSMSHEFPDSPEIWHLHHLFEGTKRHDPQDRFSTSSVALQTARRVENLVKCGYPPLESLLKDCCPSCGWGTLKPFQFSHTVFGNPNPSGIQSLQCDYCGECFAVNRVGPTGGGPKKILEARKNLS